MSELSINYQITEEGAFSYNGHIFPTYERLRQAVERDSAEIKQREDEAAARVAAAERLVVEDPTKSDTLYIWPRKDEAPEKVTVRGKAAHGGWNVTVIESGQKLQRQNVYNFSKADLQKIELLNTKRAKLLAEAERFLATLKLPAAVPGVITSLVEDQPETWKAEVGFRLYKKGDVIKRWAGKPTAYERRYYLTDYEEAGTEVVAEDVIHLDRATNEFVVRGESYSSFQGAKDHLIRAEHPDTGIPVATRFTKEVDEEGALAPFDPASSYHRRDVWIVSTSQYRKQHTTLTKAGECWSELLRIAQVGDISTDANGLIVVDL